MAELNPWKRPEPGTPTVFLSYHARDREAAKATSAVLQDLGVRVLLYSSTERWEDATLEILQRILNEAHCVVYLGRRLFKSRWVRLELEFAKKLDIPILHVRRATRASSIVPEIQCLSELPPTEPWPIVIEKYMDEVMRRYLRSEEVIGSKGLKRWSTGLSLGMRGLGYELDRNLRIQVFEPEKKDK
jgi:TIR domain